MVTRWHHCKDEWASIDSMSLIEYHANNASWVDTVELWPHRKDEWALTDLMSPITYDANNAIVWTQLTLRCYSKDVWTSTHSIRPITYNADNSVRWTQWHGEATAKTNGLSLNKCHYIKFQQRPITNNADHASRVYAVMWWRHFKDKWALTDSMSPKTYIADKALEWTWVSDDVTSKINWLSLTQWVP